MLRLPTLAPAFGDVRLRPFEPRDVEMVQDLSTDPYTPLTSTLVGEATAEQARAWIDRQHDRLVAGAGYSFCIADAVDDRALGQVGLWLADIEHGRATAGYGVAPPERGRGIAGRALTALTAFAWTVPELHRVELYIEPWNEASSRTAENAGYEREGLLRSRQVIGGRRVDMLLYSAIRPA
ncbi:GNAT family N-acetyltransferase [Cellulomonas chengniuliangii]|uniref:GNAT family N-acetyltransferase n=1 Tax=Cellulomonas chengniuliangii TaxID=2968084 RepID=A0ABY5KYH2_9CELL|nr:GNAT family protein [Cellulomonas chengniuliangii]MCC2307687.1 GNAT family N-acetyltransferase [Cellulomonas chengniuliangii]UUI75552.1 GNAT family N-acetyltransferase [Cellulomonas chengniuliangii]